MKARYRHRPGTALLLFVTAICTLLVAAEPTMAQRRIGKRGPTRGHRSDPVRRVDRQKRGQQSSLSGNLYSRILRFVPASSEEDEDLIGILKVKPVEEGSKTLKLLVRQSEELSVALGGHTFEVEDLPEVLLKGLFCNAAWEFEETDGKKKPTKRELVRVTFNTIDVEGTITDIEDDLVVIKARPLDNREWPHLKSKSGTDRRSRSGTKPKRVRQLKLKLKILDDVATFTDSERHPLDLGDFEVDQTVQATIVPGTSTGLLVNLRTLTAEDVEGVEPPPDRHQQGPRVRRRGRPRVGGLGGGRR